MKVDDLAGMPIISAIKNHPWLWRVISFLWVAVLLLALYALREQWKGLHFRDLRAALGHIGPQHLCIALSCTALSYLCNSMLDVMALRTAGLRVPLLTVFRTAFIASTFSINAGGTILGGGSVRMRSYSAAGLKPLQIAGIMVFGSVACWAGYALNAGVLLTFAPTPPAGLPHWLSSPYAGPVLMAGGIAAALIFMAVGIKGLEPNFTADDTGEDDEDPAASAPAPKPVPQFRYFPARYLLIPLSAVVSALDWFLAGLTMWSLIPNTAGVQIDTFLAAVALSQALAAFSHVPGGAGVLELTVAALLGGALGAPVLAGALVTYRVVYYLAPFALAAAILAGQELWSQRSHLAKGAEAAGKVWQEMAPRIAAGMSMIGGFVLLLSANTPVRGERRSLLEELIPLPFVEASHFTSSICGILLILLSQGLFNRINAAWWLSLILAVLGAVFSLVKGFDWEEAMLLVFFVVCLLPFKGHFYRQAALFARRFTLEWWLLILLLTSIATWIGFFSARHVQYTHELWWEFSYRGDAPRLLRALAGISVVLLVVSILQLLRPSRPHGKAHDQAPLSEIEELVSRSSTSDAQLALLGDKQFLFSKDRKAAIMYGDQGRTRVALRDTIGSDTDSDDLLWRFIEEAQNEGYRPAFYQISPAQMPYYVDLGFRLYKLGEEAIVDLDELDINSPAGRKLRQIRSRFSRDGWTFVIWSREEVAENLAVLKRISDEWLTEQRAQEKGFSLGRFEENYVRRLPCAVAIKDGQVAAFANIWKSGNKEELSIDLMRHLNSTPKGVMDFIFTELLVWGKAEGYHRFNFGMAPLSGFEARASAPLWSQVASLIFHHGEAFYNFKGLREYKQKFHPEWEPRYLAVRSQWDLPTALADITTLIGGGWRGVIGKTKAEGKGKDSEASD